MIARFADPDTLVRALRQVRARGFTRLDAFSPYPVDGLEGQFPPSRLLLALAALAGFLAGAGAALAVQIWANIDYPLNVGGRPLLAWYAFSLPALQFGTLGAVLAVAATMLAVNGLPRLHHPLFAIPEFTAATTDGFFLWIAADDPLFTQERATRTLTEAGATWIAAVDG